MNDPADIRIQEAIEDHLDALIQGVSARCEAIISEALKRVKDGELTLAEALAQLPEAKRLYEEILADGRVTVGATVDQIFTEMADLNDKKMSVFYEAMGLAQSKAMGNEVMKGVLDAAIERCKEIIAGTLNSSVAGIVDSAGLFIGFDRFYRESVAQAVTGMLAGEAAYQKAVKDAVESMVRSGLRTATTATGKRVTVIGNKVLKVGSNGNVYTREIYGAMRTEIMDNYRQALSDLRKAQGEEFGANGYEISAHAPCAPDHVQWQGQQKSKQEFEYIQGQLERPYEAWNCKHIVTPIILGLSKPAYDSDELDEMRERSEEMVTVTGRGGHELTRSRYDMTQYQRQMERELRNQKNLEYQLRTAGVDTKGLKADIRASQAEYNRISREADLTARPERARAYITK